MELHVEARKLLNGDVKVTVTSDVYVAGDGKGFFQSLVLTETDTETTANRIELRRAICDAVALRIDSCERQSALYAEEPSITVSKSGCTVHNAVYIIPARTASMAMAQARAFAAHKMEGLEKQSKIWAAAYDKVVADELTLVDFDF